MGLFDVHSDSFQYPEPLHTSLRVPADQFSERLREIIKRFGTLGITINPSSRLHSYARLLERSPHSNADIVAHNIAMLESLQFSAICRGLECLDDPTPWLAKTESATGGAMFASDDSGGSRSRSDQFELYVMATLVCAGFDVEPKEPDLVIHIESEACLGIAVKRPRSEKKVRRNLRDAARQIRGCGRLGIAAIDMSFVEDITKPIWVERPEAQQVLSKVILDGYAHENEKSLLCIASRPNVAGVLLHLSCAVRSVRPNISLISRRWLMLCAQVHPVTTAIIRGIQDIRRAPKAST